MPFYEKGKVRIHYEEAGSGFPLMIIAGLGLNSTLSYFTGPAPFNPIAEFKNEFRCIAADLRNAPDGQSTGPLEADRPWDSIAEDQLGLMDHLGVKEFMVLGFCAGGPQIWSLLKRAPGRIVAAVMAQPSGFRPEAPKYSYEGNMKGWAPALIAKRPEITMDMCDAFLKSMYHNPDFVYSVSRDFVRSCQTPVLIMPDDSTGHPYAVAMEAARLAPNSQVSLYPWKDSKDTIPIAVRHVRTFLRAHRPAR